MLLDHLNLHKIDVLFAQEHNIREGLMSSDFSDKYDIILNHAIAHKGGTAIFIRKHLNCKIQSCEMSADSRFISAKVLLYGKNLHLLNVYAPSGSRNSERDEFFKNDMIYYLRNNLDNSIIGGDFNCVTSQRDASSNSVHISNGLSNMVRDLKLKDIWTMSHKTVEYTYVRSDYGSRLDRFYVKNLSNIVSNVRVDHVSFSDHSSISFALHIPGIPRVGRYYWKLNVSLLVNDSIRNLFQKEWYRLKLYKGRYNHINDWWENCAKKGIKSFFITQSKIENQKKYDSLRFFEKCLNRLYNKCNIENKIDYARVRAIKNRINDIKTSILEGVKVRSRIDEQLQGEKVSSFLIAK